MSTSFRIRILRTSFVCAAAIGWDKHNGCKSRKRKPDVTCPSSFLGLVVPTGVPTQGIGTTQ